MCNDPDKTYLVVCAYRRSELFRVLHQDSCRMISYLSSMFYAPGRYEFVDAFAFNRQLTARCDGATRRAATLVRAHVQAAVVGHARQCVRLRELQRMVTVTCRLVPSD